MKHARLFLLMVATLLCSVSVKAQITDVSQLSNTKLYFVSQPGHAPTPTSWVILYEGEALQVNSQCGVASNQDDANQQFAFLSNDGGDTHYLYHPVRKMFVNKDASLSSLPMNAVHFTAGNQAGTFVVYFDASSVINTNDNQGLVINRWGPLSGYGAADAGNSCAITPVGEFDPTEALAAFAAAEEEKSKNIEFKAGANGWIEGADWYNQSQRVVGFTSPLYQFSDKVETLRITVNRTKGNSKFFCLSELAFYDANGQKIELTADAIVSNADHNALNPNSPDGGGIPALLDGATGTFFHSAWQNMPNADHYLEVTLPNGGYDAFSIKMFSRDGSGGANQSHTFPAEMVMATSVPLVSQTPIVPDAPIVPDTPDVPDTPVENDNPTALPQMTTDLENPIYYTIRNTRSASGKYLYYAGDNVGLKDANEITEASLFYFTGTLDACYVHNAATTKKVESVTSWSDAGTAWNIGVTPYGDGTTGLFIGSSNNSGWNERTYDDTYTMYDIRDAGSVFVIEYAEEGELPDAPATPEVSGVVSSLSAADPTKCYTVTTMMERGAWAVDDGGSKFTCTKAEGFAIDAVDARQQFAILSLNKTDYYLYSVSAKKFVKKDGSLAAGIGDAIEFLDASSMEAGRVMVRFDEEHIINVSDASRKVEINGWNTLDAGNAVLIVEAGDFDASEALAALANPEEAERNALIAQVQELLASNAANHAERPALGQYGTSAYENLAAIVVSDTATAASVEHFIAAFEASKCLPVFTIDGVNDYANGMSIYDDGGQFLRWKATDRSDESMLWAFDMTETTVGVTDKVVIRNLATGNLFMETGYGVSYIQIAETSENIADDGLFLMFREEDTGYAIWASHSGIIIPSQGIFSANSTSAWKFTYVGTTYGVEDAPETPDTPVLSGVVSSLSAADPTKCYTISTATRGAWAINDDGTYFSTTGVEGYVVDAKDARQQFAILSANGEDYYLYSVSAKKFVKCDRSLVTGVADALEFVDASSKGEGRVMVRFRDFLNSNINIGGDNQMVINGWNLIDEGNAVLIAEADDFDATEALAILANPEEAERNALIAQALELLEANADNHAVEPALGQYATRTYEYLDSVANSEEVTKNVIEDAISLFEASKCLPVFTINGVADFVAGKSIYEFNGRLYWTATDRTDESMLWMFDMTDTIVGVTDKVVVKNLATGRLFDNALFVQVAEPQDSTEGYWICPEGLGVPMFAYQDGRVERAYSWSSDSPHTWEFVYAGTTYDINELPSEPETPDTPVVPDSAVAASMPLKYMSGENGWIEGTEWIDEELGFVGYASPLYVFEEKVETFRIIVKRVQSGDKFFSLSELGFFDADGNKIELTKANVTSNADHNTLNPGRPDGGGIAALFDEDVNTYFHSAWQNIPQGDHYLEVTLPNGGYDAFSFEMISRGGQTQIFPEEMVITDAFQYELLDALYGSTGDINLCPFPEVGYYYDDLSYIEEAFSKTYELLVNNGSEAECEAMVAELTQALERYRSMDVRLPEPDKGYRVISAFPGFAEHQLVEKAITINPESNALWWEGVCADNEMQEFIFEPVLGDSGQHLSWVMDINYRGSVVTEKQYFYNMKNAATGLYVNYSPEANFHLVDQPCTVYLAPLGGGQFGIRFRIANEYGGGTIYAMHAGDHNEGYPSDSIGDYGGTFGMSSGIVSWYGEDHTASAWFIRETHELPYTMPVSEDKFKSGFVHFEATDVITLTADKECSFANLEFYSSYGYGYASSWNEGIEIEKFEVSGNTATITLDRKVTSCAFGFDNYEGVSSVTFDAMSSAAEGPSLQLVGVTPDSETSNAWVRALTLSFNKEIAVWGLGDFLRGINTGEEFYISSHHIGENSDGGYDLTLYFSGRRDGWSKLVTVPDTYTYTIPAGGIKSVDGEDFPETTVTFTVDGTFPVANYSPAETTSLEQIELTFDRVIEDITIYYGWYVENEEGDNVAYIDWGRGHGSKTVTLGLNEPITTPGKYYLHIFADAFTAEGDMPNMPADLTFIVVEDTPEVSTDYAMKAQDAKGRTSSVVNIPIEMDNVTAVNAFQFDLYLPEGISVVSTMEDDEVLYDIAFNKDRSKSSHVLAVEPQTNGALRVAAYSTSNASFVGNSGVLVNVAVAIDDVDEGDYVIAMRNIRMVTKDEEGNAVEKLGADYTATLTVENTLPGDVNSDGNVTMLDVVMTVNAVMEKEQENFNANAADLNGDGQITMVDVVGVLQLVLTEGSSRAPVRRDLNRMLAMPELNACDLKFMGNGGVVLPVALCNGEDYSAFQLDVQLPAGVELADVALAGRARASHTMAWNTLSDGTIRVVAYAVDNATFSNDEEALLNLVLNTSDDLSSDAEVVLTDGLFASVDGSENRAPAVSVLMRSDATSIGGAVASAFRVYGTEGAVVVECGADTAVSIYAVTGKLVQQATVEPGKNIIPLPGGVYIVNGNKVIVK